MNASWPGVGTGSSITGFNKCDARPKRRISNPIGIESKSLISSAQSLAESQIIFLTSLSNTLTLVFAITPAGHDLDAGGRP